MKATKKRKIASALLLLLLALAMLISCDGSSDGGEEVTEAVPYVNVYVPYKDVLVTVQYDEARGQLKNLRETLKSALTMAGHTVTGNDVLLGIYDMAEGGNIVYNADGILHNDYVFESGVTLFAQYNTFDPSTVPDSKTLVFQAWPKDSANKEVFRTTTVTEGEQVTRFTPVSFVTSEGSFAGWAEAESGRLVTYRDGRLRPDYDIWSSTETEFYPKIVPGKVNRCFLHIEGETVSFEYSSNLNATAALPTDERDGRGIIGWSTDPKAKYPSDIIYPTYLGAKKAYTYVKEGAHYYPIYSEYKDVTYVYDGVEETERIYKYYPEGNEWNGQLMWDVQESEVVYLPRYYFDKGSNKTVTAYLTASGEIALPGAVSYDSLESRYYGIVKRSVEMMGITFNDNGSTDIYRYTIANAVINLPKGKYEEFFELRGWYLDSEGKGNKVLYLYTDEYGELYIVCEGDGKPIRYSNNGCTLYAIYNYGG